MHKHVCCSLIRGNRCRRGAMLPLIAILLPVLVILLGFSVDLAFMQATRAELRAATDTAARAGAIALVETEDSAAARAAAIDMAARNKVAGKKLTLREQDVEIGRSERDADGQWVFTSGGTPWNSVRVHADRSSTSADGAVALFFNSFYGGADFEPKLSAVSTFLNVDVCLVLDRSGSMQGQKLRDLRNAVNVFLNELEKTDADEQVALASYSDKARLDWGLDTDYAPIREKVNNYKASGMTAIGLGLYQGIDGVTGSGRRTLSTPIIVLMTDGQHNRGVEPIEAAREAASEGITVHTITFGTGADIKRMRAVADETGGRHYHAISGSQLAEVFCQIAKTLPTQLSK